jgi:hypothetical protein
MRYSNVYVVNNLDIDYEKNFSAQYRHTETIRNAERANEGRTFKNCTNNLLKLTASNKLMGFHAY